MAAAENVFKYLDASTGNLPAEVFHAIQDGEHDKVILTRHNHGAWVWVPPDDGDEVHDVSQELPALDAIYKVARSLDCRWINFDQDAEPLDGLPFFDW